MGRLSALLILFFLHATNIPIHYRTRTGRVPGWLVYFIEFFVVDLKNTFSRFEFDDAIAADEINCKCEVNIDFESLNRYIFLLRLFLIQCPNETCRINHVSSFSLLNRNTINRNPFNFVHLEDSIITYKYRF